MRAHLNARTPQFPDHFSADVPLDHRGFSLIETMTVVVIMGMLVSLALPRFSIASYQANSGARVVATALSYAQRLAISRQADVRVAFDMPKNRLRLHEDRNNDNTIDADERVVFTNLPDGVTFGRGSATARSLGGAVVTFTKAQGGLPVLVFRRDGTASENGVIYLSTLAGLSVDRTADVRAVEISQGPGRTTWYSFASGGWKAAH
jgi:prepilin-type N-terminal cleavage/methylation domain-containing protein